MVKQTAITGELQTGFQSRWYMIRDFFDDSPNTKCRFSPMRLYNRFQLNFYLHSWLCVKMELEWTMQKEEHKLTEKFENNSENSKGWVTLLSTWSNGSHHFKFSFEWCFFLSWYMRGRFQDGRGGTDTYVVRKNINALNTHYYT